MKSIKVSFRAVFEFPAGALNPMGVKISGPQPVEVFATGNRWRIRELTTSKRNVFEKLGTMDNAASAKAVAEKSFRDQLQPWQMWGQPPRSDERIIDPDEIAGEHEGKLFWKEDDDYTHIIDPKAPGRVPPGICGAQVKGTSFISPAANVAPTCKVCAEYYRKEWAPRKEAVKK